MLSQKSSPRREKQSLEEAVAEDVGEAGAAEEEEGARDDNFLPHNCYQILGNFGFFFFVQVLFMVSIFNKLKSEKVVFAVLVKSGEGGAYF